MKKSYDSKHEEEEYQEGAWVYVRLQPYRQISVSIRHAKIAPRYYGPFHIQKRIGQVVYKLELLIGSHIHPVFHMSSKKKLGSHISAQPQLLVERKLGSHISAQQQLLVATEDQEELKVQPQAVLDQRQRRKKIEILVHWQGLPSSDATWEDLQLMRQQFPGYALADKGPFKRVGADMYQLH